ncbi:hypothetical protein BG000_006716, partial [Podila horticola]
HPAFAAKGANEGCFGRNGKNCRVVKGWDFVGDAYDGTNTPKPDSDPMDCQGHGSHVAGIVGGDARNVKTAPLPPQPFVGGAAYKYNPEAALSDKLIARGMALAASAGNDGSAGPWMVGNTGLGDLSTSVASFDNAYGNYRTFTFTGGVASPYAPANNWGKPIELNGASLVPLLNKDGTLADGCEAAQYTGLDVKGKVVLTLGDFTRCGSGARGTVAINAGVGALLVQTTPY